MGFMSHLQKNVELRPEQKWDYITLNDFKSSSCFTMLAYVYLHFSLCLSIAVYAVDTFTAVNLLVFNQWSSEISPTQLISFEVAKWIFSICIILSFLNLGYEHIRAQRIMHRGSVAECYLDNLAVRLESIRWGKGQGWKRFLVFAELTKSKKGAEYIALFTYFSFQSWFRVLLCSGPRQAVNALTLLSVYNAQLSVTGDNVGNTLLNFFDKIRTLAEQNTQEAVILSGMIFTLLIWIFSFLSLLLAFAFFVFFLWGYIPRTDDGLSGYCSRKINKRLMKIVAAKVSTAIEEEERRRKKAELKAARKAGALPPTELTATIPDVSDNKLPQALMLHRNDTMATLPPYTSRPGTSGGSSSIELSTMDQKTSPPTNGGRPMPPTRSGTMASMASMSTTSAPPPGNTYSTRAPLLGYAAEPGRSASPAPSLPAIRDMGTGNNGMNNNNGSFNSYNNNNFGPPLMRPGTAASERTIGGPAPSAFPPPNRANTAGGPAPFSINRNGSVASNGFAANTPPAYSNDALPAMPQPVRSQTGYSGSRPPAGPLFGPGNNFNDPSPDRGHNPSTSTSSGRYAPYRPDDNNGRASPAPSTRSYGPGSGMSGGMGGNNPNMAAPAPRGPGMSPVRSATQQNPLSPRAMTPNGGNRGNYGPGPNPPFAPPRRNLTTPMTAPMDDGSNGGGLGLGHERQISEDSSYSSYFEPPSTAGSPRSAVPRRPNYGNANGTGGSVWNNDVEAQRNGRY